MHEKSIELLNRAVADEMWAVHQYMYFHFHCDDQGYDLLANLFKLTAMKEMLHTEALAERILFLNGEVKMKASQEVEEITDVRAMLEKALAMEEEAVTSYNTWAMECAAAADSVSKALFETLVVDEELHWDQFDTQLGHLEKFGEQFLVLQSFERSRAVGGGGAAEPGA